MARISSYMPIYIGDYLADTGHLSAAQHGCYLLLIFHYWRTGLALPDNDSVLGRIGRMTEREWVKSSPTIRAFFHRDVIDGVPVLTHTRIEAELARAAGKYEQAAEAGRRSAAARELARQRNTQRNVNGRSTDGATEGTTNSPTKTQEPDKYNQNQIVPNGTITPKPPRASRSVLNGSLEVFEAFWEIYPLHKARRQAEKAFVSALKRAATPEQIIAGAQRYRDDPARKPEFTKHPATWLNADGWLDEAEAVAPPAQESTIDRMIREAKEREAKAAQNGP